MNLGIALAAGSLFGGAAALLARADLRLRRRPTTRERLAGWSGAARDRAIGAVADAVTAMIGAVLPGRERARG